MWLQMCMHPTTATLFFFFFFFNDTATTEIYTLSLHDALPISATSSTWGGMRWTRLVPLTTVLRSEEHTSELQSRQYLVCRLLLEKKKKQAGSLKHCVRSLPLRYCQPIA